MVGYFRNIWRLRYFWMALVRIDLRARYRRSIIGVGWSLLHPIAMTTVLCVVFSTAFQADIRTYAPFLLAGLVTWNFFVAAINQGCHCFFQGESYIRQYPAPLAIYPLRCVLGGGIHLLIGLVLSLAVVWCTDGPRNLIALPSLAPTLVLLFLFGWSIAVCAGVINVLFQDTQHLVEVGVQILFYMTPVMYAPELLEQRNLSWFVMANPVALFLDLVRRPILHGEIPSLQAFAAATTITACAVLCTTVLLWKAERRIIFYL